MSQFVDIEYLDYYFFQQILRNDGLPKQICESCFYKVHEANETKKLCRTSEERLKQLLKEIQAMSDLGET
jgi:Zinc-finger associated domain (zf-AD)